MNLREAAAEENPEDQDDGRDPDDGGEGSASYYEGADVGDYPPEFEGSDVNYDEEPVGEVPPSVDINQMTAGVRIPAPGKFEDAGRFNPEGSTFDERQQNMTAQERADWASKKFGGPVQKDPTGKPAPAGVTAPAAAEPAEPKKSPRELFEEQVFQQLGGDPFMINTMKIVDDVTRKDLPELFQKVFGGKVIWEDRDRLNKAQNAFWQDEVKKYRAHVKEQVEGEKSFKKEAYKEMMGRFDMDQKTRAAEEKQKLERAQKFAQGVQKQSDIQTKAVEALQRQDNTLRNSEMSIMSKMSELVKAAEGKLDKMDPETMKNFDAMQNELNRVRVERDNIRMRLDPAYRQQKMAEAEIAKREAQTNPTRDPKAEEPTPKPAPDPEAMKALAIKPHPEKGVPVKAKFNKETGEVLVIYKDGTQEIRK